MRTQKFFYQHPGVCLSAIAILHLSLAWPGFWSADTSTQYAMALSGVYTDHHPPIMSWLWGYLNQLLPGSGLLLILHFSWLYAAVFYLMKSVEPRPMRLLYLAFPLIPQILLYAACIWKDVGFAFSFLYCAAYLGFLTMQQRKMPWYALIVFILSLFYGTAVKFQAQYCAPVLLIWLCYVLLEYQINVKRFVLLCVVILLIFYTSLNSLNNYWVPDAQKSQSWQLVKIYDLAAISLESGTDFIPAFMKNKNFSEQALAAEFNRCQLIKRVDDLIFGHHPILKKGDTPTERQIVYQAWLKAVLSHPFLYLKHRISNMLSILFSRPGASYVLDFLSKISTPNALLYRILFGIYTAAFEILIAHWSVAALGVVYFILALKALGKSRAAIPLLAFNAIGLTMLLVLFFCSMAGTARYTYILACMVHASHLLAYQCYQWIHTKVPTGTRLNKSTTSSALI